MSSPDPNDHEQKAKDDLDHGPGPDSRTPVDFWQVIYGRRSVRRFDNKPVPRKLIDQVMHAGIWAPSSCNYQMWDVVAVDDPKLNGQLAQLSTQLGNGPVNLVVSYGRDFSEEGFANIQSASAMIQNMGLAAHALGLGTFWITQMGDREELREKVGLPRDRVVIAVLALGYPEKSYPEKQGTRAPGRRPLERVTHYNRYAGEPIPSSTDPAQWTPELLATYQRARVLNGLRHNKPRAWEIRALEGMLARLVPEGIEKVSGDEKPLRWLDVLPCNGILTDKLSRERKGFQFDIVERSREVADFVAKRTRPRAEVFGWPPASQDAHLPAPVQGTYDVVSCLYRLEDLAPADRTGLVRDMASWLRPGGKLILAYVSRRSFHQTTEKLRKRRGGLGGVEYVLSPDPNIGPFEALPPAEVEGLVRDASLTIEQTLGLQAVPQPEEIAFRTRNFSAAGQGLARAMAGVLALFEKLPGMKKRRGRFQFLAARKD